MDEIEFRHQYARYGHARHGVQSKGKEQDEETTMRRQNTARDALYRGSDMERANTENHTLSKSHRMLDRTADA
jgi:hypothetical protein